MLILLFPIMVHGMLKDGVTTWVPTYISENFLTSPSFSVLITTLLPIFNLAGAYLARYIYQKCKNNETRAASVFSGFLPWPFCSSNLRTYFHLSHSRPFCPDYYFHDGNQYAICKYLSSALRKTRPGSYGIRFSERYRLHGNCNFHFFHWNSCRAYQLEHHRCNLGVLYGSRISFLLCQPEYYKVISRSKKLPPTGNCLQQPLSAGVWLCYFISSYFFSS